MKVARIIIRSVQLVCPDCQQVITASNGEQTLHADGDISLRWEHVRKHGLTCPACHALFTLPPNPFTGKWK